ncbi:MAG TPA: RluA family pseudouridine synthase [Gemmataceae bacterium]|nr:RluA family pseudouridine synthase [Gemmataceae bacterium]
MSRNTHSWLVSPEQAGQTLAAVVRSHLPGQSWKQVRQHILSRRVKIGDELCLDPARRVNEGETIAFLNQSAKLPRAVRHPLVIRYLDEHVVVVEKPSGISTVRHPAEREWDVKRRELSPTLEDRVQAAIASQQHVPLRLLPRLRIVQRLDKETSGLVVFARSPLAEVELGRQFRKHTVIRRYLALIPGFLPAQTIRSRLVRDRGDRRRGSTNLPEVGKEAVTHIEVAERLPGFTLLSCRLETGRTHQIRIHLAEAGHPICGERVYNRRDNGEIMADESGAKRLALHAIELGFVHPVTEAPMHWTMEMPEDMRELIESLKG